MGQVNPLYSGSIAPEIGSGMPGPRLWCGRPWLYNRFRPHLALDKHRPIERQIMKDGVIVVGSLRPARCYVRLS